MEDVKIVDLYWKRSEKALSETAKKYGKYCMTIAYNVLANTNDSEECVNDTWFAAWRYIPPKKDRQDWWLFWGKLQGGSQLIC